MPRVSVIIPTYNRREYVQEAIDSVLAVRAHLGGADALASAVA